MKVKKKYFILGCSILLLLMLLLIIFSITQYYNVTIGDGIKFAQNGFSFSPASTEQVTEYISDNQLDIDILHYTISLELLPKEKLINGKVIITGKPKNKNVETVILNFYDNFNISKLTLNDQDIKYRYEDNKLALFTDSEIADTFLIGIEYSGTPESMGFGSFEFSEVDEEPVIYTLNEPIYASTWFPCNDLPSDKVLADIFITCDSSLTAVSNGSLINVSATGNKKTFHWKSFYPIATYLISFSVGDYVNFNQYYKYNDQDSMKISYFVFPSDLKNAKTDFSFHPEAINFFSNTFGEYPFLKEKYGVVENLWNFGAIEHQTITGIGRSFVSGSQFFTDVLVHELAHQWWGNAVTLESWKDIWLNEGFATYSEALYWENESGFSSLKSTMNSFLTNFDGTTLYNPENLFSRITYNKGAWVLHMLRKEIGDDNFFSLLKSYYEKFKYKNASTADFEELASEISNKDLSKFFNQWIYDGKGKIEIEYFINQKNENAVFLQLNQVQKGFDEYNFSIDIEFELFDGTKILKSISIDKRENQFKLEFNDLVKNLILDPDGWLAFKSMKIDK
ncbi:MAG: M1 family metallopeptidase [Ignavibacteriae bacterium]|nr:M1 family metallopeptidase [Ignavibacteriota bacterium]